MSMQRPEQQVDLLHQATLEGERDRLPPHVRAAVIGLLKVLLAACAVETAKTRSADE
jgi:hypothetical protein